MSEFKSFGKIQHIGKMYMSITQKIHGSNAQIYITEDGAIFVGSRTKWLAPGKHSDNFGFAAFVHENEEEIKKILGPGRHYGEWAGPGINSGEGLSQKTLFLFNWRRWKETPLPNQISTVPLLHTGKLDLNEIDFVMAQLKQNGSRICPGFMKPEGIVIEVGGDFYKKVFDPEETGWTTKGIKEPRERIVAEHSPIDHLLQPIRLEKLLSRDEGYIRDYPSTLPDIIKCYVKDLEEEEQIIGTEEEIDKIKKALGRKIFIFVKDQIRNRN